MNQLHKRLNQPERFKSYSQIREWPTQECHITLFGVIEVSIEKMHSTYYAFLPATGSVIFSISTRFHFKPLLLYIRFCKFG